MSLRILVGCKRVIDFAVKVNLEFYFNDFVNKIAWKIIKQKTIFNFDPKFIKEFFIHISRIDFY